MLVPMQKLLEFDVFYCTTLRIIKSDFYEKILHISSKHCKWKYSNSIKIFLSYRSENEATECLISGESRQRYDSRFDDYFEKRVGSPRVQAR